MHTQCNGKTIRTARIGSREVVADFDGGRISSDAGALLLGGVDQVLKLTERVAACFQDGRDPELIEHSVQTLVMQRIVGIALGYEDLNDHDQLRSDPVMAALAGKLQARRKRCEPLAGKSTLNRLEHAPMPEQANRYRKIAHDASAFETLFVDCFLEAHAEPPQEIVLDLDATDDPLHGNQEGRFFHGYYGSYCYLPLYIFCGRHLLVAKLRHANTDASAGSVEEIERLVGCIRRHWPKVRIVLRADSGFAPDALMSWCEAHQVDFVFGLAKNDRLKAQIAAEMAEAQQACAVSGQPERRFGDFRYRTRDSWNCARRIVGKAEHLPGKANPRFIVTSLPANAWSAQALYEQFYCARGEMENRIKECQLDLFADRTSTATMHANQLRLWFASFAYIMLDALRRIGLHGTALANATCASLRLKLLKIGAQVRTSVRRIHIAMASSHPHQDEWRLAQTRLRPG
jgi:Transposase DDE domain group 1